MTSTITDGTNTVTPLMIYEYQSTRTAQTRIHPIIGLQYPDVTLRPALAREGTLWLLFDSEADSVAAENLFGAGATDFTLTDPDVTSVDMTFVVSGEVRRILDADRALWRLEVAYQEVAPA